MSRTKRDLVDAMVSRAVREAIEHLCFVQPALTTSMKEWHRILAWRVGHNVVGQDYRWLELCDVMNWRRRKISDGPRERFQED